MTNPAMTAEELELWKKIEAFSFDAPDVAFTFTARLAKEHGWDLGHAAEVVTEYRKFLFLAVRAGHPVSPPDAVDHAWHLHLLYTRSYWKDMCGDILGRPLHHEPTEGGMAEEEKFHDWYGRTLESYRRCFGEPPTGIWLPLDQRSQPKREQWVDVSRHWLLPRPRFLKRIRPLLVAGAGMVILATAMLAGCASVGAVFDMKGPDFLALYIGCFVLAAGLSFLLEWHLRRAGDEIPAQGITDVYDIAYLGGGGGRVVDCALAALHGRSAFQFRRAKNAGVLIQRAPASEDMKTWHPTERLVFYAMPQMTDVKLYELRRALVSAMDVFRQRLSSIGLVFSPEQLRRLRWAVALPFVGLVLAGLFKMALGSSRGKPISFLLFLCIGTLVVMCLRLVKLNRRTAAGERLWWQLRNGERPEVTLHREPATPMAVALTGLAALTGMGYGPLQAALKRPGGDGGSGCGAVGCGTGGSGCSGGGGGCGGGSGCGGCGGGSS